MGMASTIQTMQSSTLPAPTHPHSSATTAAVHEHACLFTHDLRRKQKRWQDGRLKYHTFNRRVMVYDERGNFVGDAHWREDYDLADGDDLELERGGIIIQVGERIGSRDQDLSELVDKRAQEKAQRQAAAAARRPPTTPIAPRQVAKPQPLLQKHLHDVIGTPSGHHGRAVVPRESPYEERQQRQTPLQGDKTRPAKRQRREVSPLSKSGYAQNLFGATLTLSGRPLSQVPARHRQSRASQTREEIVSPPSSYTSNHNDSPSTTIDAAQSIMDLHNRPPRQMLLQADHVHFHSSARPALHSHINSDVPKELEERPAAQQKQLKLIANQKEGLLRRQSILDSSSRNQDIGKLREVNEDRDPANLNLDRIDKRPTARAKKKLHDNEMLGAGNNCVPGRRPRDTDTIDLTEDLAKNPQNQPILDEPRTELRIRPRKKRGLVMMSERQTQRPSSSESESNKIRPGANCLLLTSEAQRNDASTNIGGKRATFTDMQHKQLALPKGKRKSTTQQNMMGGCSNDNRSDDEDCCQSPHIDNARHSAENERDETQYLGQSGPNTWRDTKLSSTNEQSDTQQAETYAIETRRRLRPRDPLSTEDASFSSAADGEHGGLLSVRRENHATVDEMPAPRLAKLGRKSIKSREVIGFIFDEESDPTTNVKRNDPNQKQLDFNPRPDQNIDNQHHETESKIGDRPAPTELQLDGELQSRRKTLQAGKGSITLQRQNRGKPRPPDGKPSQTVQSKEAPSITTTTATKQPIPPIVNPATRGKKAAKPSDAAGQMPTCPLSVESAGSSSLNQASRKIDPQGNLEQGSASPMPGFSRANGGPWSREAHDLFDFKRPS